MKYLFVVRWERTAPAYSMPYSGRMLAIAEVETDLSADEAERILRNDLEDMVEVDLIKAVGSE